MLKGKEISAISTDHWLISIAVETLGPINQEGSAFLDEQVIALHKFQRTHESARLHQRISVIIQRFNSIAFRSTFIDARALYSLWYTK